MRKNRFLLVVVLLVACAVLLARRLSLRGQDQDAEKAGSVTSLPVFTAGPSPEIIGVGPRPPAPNPNADQTKTVLISPEVKASMLACARGSETLSGLGRAAEFDTLNQYLDRAPVIRGGAEAIQELLIENIQLSNKNGQKIRVRITPENSHQNGTNKNRSKTEVFGVDSDDLPIVMPLPMNLVGLSASEVMTELKREYANLDYDRKTVAFRWSNGASGTVSYRDGNIDEMQLYFENRGSMGCAVESGIVRCSCLEPANR